MAETKITGSSQRNTRDVAYELTQLYYTVLMENKENTIKDIKAEDIADAYLTIYNKVVSGK